MYFVCVVQELRYAEFAEGLQRNLTFLHKRSAELEKELQKQHHLILDQIIEMHRLEVTKAFCSFHLLDQKVNKVMQVSLINIFAQKSRSII